MQSLHVICKKTCWGHSSTIGRLQVTNKYSSLRPRTQLSIKSDDHQQRSTAPLVTYRRGRTHPQEHIPAIGPKMFQLCVKGPPRKLMVALDTLWHPIVGFTIILNTYWQTSKWNKYIYWHTSEHSNIIHIRYEFAKSALWLL